MAQDPNRRRPPTRAAFARFVPTATRCRDNDACGHLNNVVSSALFDSVVNAILIEAGLQVCASLTYPEPAEVGLAVEHLGRSSVSYHLEALKADAPNAGAPAATFTSMSIEQLAVRSRFQPGTDG
jgi:acyl-CoA thioester hydrolase